MDQIFPIFLQTSYKTPKFSASYDPVQFIQYYSLVTLHSPDRLSHQVNSLHLVSCFAAIPPQFSVGTRYHWIPILFYIL